MNILIIVHGVVQGVGYRAYVKRKANSMGVNGFVRNVFDGSVEVFVSGDGYTIDSFVKSIDISMKNGPQVHKIERNNKFLSDEKFDSFIVKPTRTA